LLTNDNADVEHENENEHCVAEQGNDLVLSILNSNLILSSIERLFRSIRRKEKAPPMLAVLSKGLLQAVT
jgi:hypothetical protein